MLIALLILNVLILLFGAAVIKGWLKNAFGVALGVILLTGLLLVLRTVFGEKAFWVIWICAGTVLLIAVVWARNSDGPDGPEAILKARVKYAKKKREARRKKEINW